MQDFLELSVSAAASGCIYGLVALAYLLMIRPTGIINFAVGEWAMVAAFGGHLLLSRYEWPYAAGMAAVALMAVPVVAGPAGPETALGSEFVEDPLLGVVSAYEPAWIADVMRLSPGTVAATLSAARKRLATTLAAQGHAARSTS